MHFQRRTSNQNVHVFAVSIPPCWGYRSQAWQSNAPKREKTHPHHHSIRQVSLWHARLMWLIILAHNYDFTWLLVQLVSNPIQETTLKLSLISLYADCFYNDKPRSGCEFNLNGSFVHCLRASHEHHEPGTRPGTKRCKAPPRH